MILLLLGRSPRRLRVFLRAFCWAVSLTVLIQTNVMAGLFDTWLPETNIRDILPTNGEELIVERCAYLDGRCVFKVAAPYSEIDSRLSYIQTQINKLKMVYNEANEPDIEIIRQRANSLTNVVIRVADEPEIRLMTVTRWDAELNGEEISSRAEQIIDQLQGALETSRYERTREFLQQRWAIAAGILLSALLLSLLGHAWQRRLIIQRKRGEETLGLGKLDNLITTQLNQRQLENIHEVKLRLSQLLQGGAIIAATLIMPGLFAQTRITQIWLLSIFRYPLRLALIGIMAYLAIRLSYVFITWCNQWLAAGAFSFLTQQSSQRLELRINTFSRVMRSIFTLIVVVIALLSFLWSININVAPILAGAGIIGLAISFAAQSLLKDIINGFCIILEDQYAVGDVITMGDHWGLVENINLRITQIRDKEGALITIPNSEVKIVANHSSHWSRADVNIPVPYQMDTNESLELLGEVCQAIYEDPTWRSQIIEVPRILGVESFNERGVVIKIWIKTRPLKQWDVSREFRLRVKTAFAAKGFNIAIPQREVWLSSQPEH